jgi:hypothetical protein
MEKQLNKQHRIATFIEQLHNCEGMDKYYPYNLCESVVGRLLDHVHLAKRRGAGNVHAQKRGDEACEDEK